MRTKQVAQHVMTTTTPRLREPYGIADSILYGIPSDTTLPQLMTLGYWYHTAAEKPMARIGQPHHGISRLPGAELLSKERYKDPEAQDQPQ